MDCVVHGVTESWTRLSDFHFPHIRTFAHGLPHAHFTLFSLKCTGLGHSCHSDFTLNITSSLKLFLTTLNVLVVQLITSPSFKSLHSCEHYLACSCFLNLSLFLCCLRSVFHISECNLMTRGYFSVLISYPQCLQWCMVHMEALSRCLENE